MKEIKRTCQINHLHTYLCSFLSCWDSEIQSNTQLGLIILILTSWRISTSRIVWITCHKTHLHVVNDSVNIKLWRACDHQVFLFTRYEVTVNREFHRRRRVRLTVHSIHPPGSMSAPDSRSNDVRANLDHRFILKTSYSVCTNILLPSTR